MKNAKMPEMIIVAIMYVKICGLTGEIIFEMATAAPVLVFWME